jgi:1-acyl-sn-glycerol-3-phosphate acyltransferase
VTPSAPAAPAVPAPSVHDAAIGRHIGQVLFHGLYRSSAHGAGHVPLDGPVLLAANHASFIDGPLVFGLAPRPVHFLVKAEMFRGFPGWVLDHVGQIPVDRSGIDRPALQTALAALRAGGAVGVFPEGSRGRGDVSAAREGITWLAMASGAPVVPVACLGTRRGGAGPHAGSPAHPGRRLAVVFGEPLHLRPQAGVPRRVASRQLTEDLRRHLAQHVIDSARTVGLRMNDQAGAVGAVHPEET